MLLSPKVDGPVLVLQALQVQRDAQPMRRAAPEEVEQFHLFSQVDRERNIAEALDGTFDVVPGNHGADTFRWTGIDHISRKQAVVAGQMSDQSRYRMNQQAEIGA